MRHIQAILWKQIKDTFKNKEVLIQFLMFPVLTFFMENFIEIENMPEHFFTNMFAVMYVGMAPLTSIAAIIAEEKEKNTLRVLRLSNVKAGEYLIGNAIYIWVACMIGSLVIGLAGGYTGKALVTFMTVMALGHLCSILVGAAIGVISKSQMAATSISVPVMMVLAFLPMLSMFNESIRKVAKFFYSEQISLLINGLPDTTITAENVVILVCNGVAVVTSFVLVYRKAFVNK